MSTGIKDALAYLLVVAVSIGAIVAQLEYGLHGL